VETVVEPLCRDESNILNRVLQVHELVRDWDFPGVGVLADTWHMEQEGEPFSAIVDAAPRIRHVHTAGDGRRAPVSGDPRHRALASACRALSPDVRLSIECNWSDYGAQCAEAISHLRDSFDR